MMYEFSRGSWTATILLIFMALSYFADFPRIVLLKHTTTVVIPNL